MWEKGFEKMKLLSNYWENYIKRLRIYIGVMFYIEV